MTNQCKLLENKAIKHTKLAIFFTKIEINEDPIDHFDINYRKKK